MTDVPSDSGDPASTTRHEPDGVSVRGMVMLGIGLLSLVVVTLLGVALVFRAFVPGSPLVTINQRLRQESMIPGVMPNQAYERQRIEAVERALLSQYRWQDKKHDFARIPLERAIELMAKRKLRVEWPKNETAESSTPTVNPPDGEPK